MHASWVRYFGVGRMVACFHVEPIAPNSIALPPQEINLSITLQQAWLQQELQELSEVRCTRDDSCTHDCDMIQGRGIRMRWWASCDLHGSALKD